MKGLHETVKVVQVVPPETVTATLTTFNNTTSAAATGIDLVGFDEAVCELSLGKMTGVLDVELFDSATDDGTVATQIKDINAVSAKFGQLGSGDDDKTQIIRIKAKDVKQFLFVKVTNADNDSKAFGINMLLGAADIDPVTQDETVDFAHKDNPN